jgi:threonine synthase
MTWRSYLSHLECSMTGERYPADVVQGLSRVGRPLLARYDLEAVRRDLPRDALKDRDSGLWRYRELLPVANPIHALSLGEIATPLIPLLGEPGTVLVKDEGRLPTGSFKARGLCVAVSMAHQFGITRVAIPTNGNAGAAMAAYATRAGMESFCFCPDDTPEVNVREMAAQGAKVWRVNGLINDCGRIVGEGKGPANWFDISTLKEPYRIEGKKTMGLELAEQLGWALPDAIFYPTGGGTGLIGMWKAFDELEALGWIGSARPKMIAVQAEGCAPIVKAFEAGVEHADLWQNAQTLAAGIRVPAAVGDFLILRAVRASGGWAQAVSDAAIEAALDLVAKREGLLLCPEGAATHAAYQLALADGRVSASDKVVLFNCASGLKYELPRADATLDRNLPVNYAALLGTAP